MKRRWGHLEEGPRMRDSFMQLGEGVLKVFWAKEANRHLANVQNRVGLLQDIQMVQIGSL